MRVPALALRRVDRSGAALAALTAAERGLLAARASAKRRAEFAAGRAAARAALRRLLGANAAGAEVLRDEAGGTARPLAVGDDGAALGVHLSITHAGGLAAAAAGLAPLGLDLVVLEPLGRAFEEEAFTPGELAAWERFTERHLPGVPAACAAFAAKEAAVKWLGTGLTVPLRSVEVLPAGVPAPARLGDALAGLAVALAIETPDRSVRLAGWVTASRRRLLLVAAEAPARR